jgi:hypothetical protein
VAIVGQESPSVSVFGGPMHNALPKNFSLGFARLPISRYNPAPCLPNERIALSSYLKIGRR